MTPETALVWVFAVLGLALLAYLALDHTRETKGRRGRLFEQVEHLFEDVEVAQDGINFPVLTGKYGGDRVRLEPIMDTAAYRKLPVLWLLVTLYRPLPVAAPLDVLLRPLNTEFFSPNSGFEGEITPGVDWPEHVRVASPEPSKAPPLSAFDPFLPFIADPLTKEVLITPRGARLVHQLAQGSQARYRVTRGVDLDPIELTPARLLPLLGVALEMCEAMTTRQRT